MQEYATLIFKEFIPSKSGIKKAIKNGQFLVDGNKATTGFWIYPNLEITLIEDPSKKPKVFEFNLEVIFDDEHMAVINKPAGIIVSGNTFKTIFNALPFNLKPSTESDALFKPTPVHRLDNQTSGILLIAKTKTAQINLGGQFTNKTIQKKYCAIVIGEISNQTINSPIENKPSETNIELVKTAKSLKYANLSFVNAFPKTGRTHQIRIHLASINNPILGDKLYGDDDMIHKGKGLFLAATEITFSHPKNNNPIHLKIATPNKFNSILAREERRWNSYNQ